MENTENIVWVNNLDEIKAALRNEFALHTRSVIKAVAGLENKDVRVNNLDEVPIVKSVEIGNLAEMLEVLNAINTELQKKFEVNVPEAKINVSSPDVKVNVPAPVVNVPAPVVNVPAPIVNIPAMDFDDIIKALDRNLNKIRTNDKGRPLAVRLSDGQNFIGKMMAAVEKQELAFTGFNENMRLRNSQGTPVNPATEESLAPPSAIGDGSKTVTSAGARVALSATSIPCRKVIITALEDNTGTIWVGGSTVAAGRGRPLVALQAETLDINDLSKVYLDASVDGEGVSYAYLA